MTKQLNRLSTLAGILPEYVDNWNDTHRASEATQRDLLAAMGIDTSTPEAIDAAINEFELKPWHQPLAPVSVTRQPDPVRIHLRLPEQDGEKNIRWRIAYEHGGSEEGLLRPSNQPPVEKRDIDGVMHAAWTWEMPIVPETGYHWLELFIDDFLLASQTVIIAPQTCYQPASVSNGGRVWGPAIQLYAVRSERNWGIGDFTDLRLLVEQWGHQGADIIGLNPLHALFPHNPEHASPYSPSSRLFLNILYIDPENVEDFHECETVRAHVRTPEFQMRLEELRNTDMVDYTGVAAAKIPVLEMLYRHFRERHLEHGSDRANAFYAFRDQVGKNLYLYALFSALQEHFHKSDPSIWGWPVWPEAFHRHDSNEVRQFESAHQERIDFHIYLQWQACQQLGATGKRSYELGLGVGLYLDLAVSIDGGGSEAWSNHELYANGAGVGAPPERNNQLGQDWGLLPYVPERLRSMAYAPFIDTLRHNMCYAGALRLDHVMGLMRQYWVPSGKPATEGAYVLYPLDDLLGILALESQRNQCMIIGEDLGTVPDEVRAALAPMGTLSYRLLFEEKDANGDFIDPENYPVQALAAVTTHDWPTLAGYWDGRDIVRRTELNLFSSEESRRAQIVNRASERAVLLLALEQADLLPEGVTSSPSSLPTVTPEFIQAVHVYLARSPSMVLMVQLEDMLGVLDQINIPSTTTENPNWRRKLPLNVKTTMSDRRILELATALRQERPRTRTTPTRKRRLRIPQSTYRIQLNSSFGFRQAAELVPYLAQLGISHVYCSPYLKARPGSTHGYDIVDHQALNPEIGSDEDFDAFVSALKTHNMGQILDVVPNHMGVMGADNQWWLDVLENGPASVYAPYFDIDWHPLKDELAGKVLLPILGTSYGEILENAELKLNFDQETGSFSVWYYQHRLPVSPCQYPRLLRHRIAILETQASANKQSFTEISSLITAFENLPPRTVSAPDKILERNRDRELLKRRLAMLAQESETVREMIAETLADYNGQHNPQTAATLMHELLEAQAWRIANWRVASDEINYRRFFDINDLAALRIEDSNVFRATHQLVLELLSEGKIDGLRIDHPDGLYDPLQYFQRIQEHAAMRFIPSEGNKAVYIVVEKILAAHENLREDWPVHGTTGYDFCNLVNGLFVVPEAMPTLERTWRAFSEGRPDFEEMVYEGKQQMMKQAMSSELNVLAGQLSRISEMLPHTRDYTTNNLRNALAELIAMLPVYRTYVREGHTDELDRRYVEWAVGRAKKHSQVMDLSIYDFIAAILLLDAATWKDEAYAEAITAFAMKFQQVSSPVMAKGCEDTAFYRHHGLVSLNEVGGEPNRFGTSIRAFHAENERRLAKWPHAMLNTSTHDNKRSEDVRCRINVLTEIPDLWHNRVQRWRRLARIKKTHFGADAMNSLPEKYLLFQTLIGMMPPAEVDGDTWQDIIARVDAYMLKAAREAKVHTSWINPDEAYETALSEFVRSLLEPDNGNTFLADFLPFQRRIARWGMFNSLSQVLLKLTSPGVPDIYQGNELLDFSLVDPDNRRPVDYTKRWAMLNDMQENMSPNSENLAEKVRGLLDDMSDGRAKLYLTWRLLQTRRRWPRIFQSLSYTPLECTGQHAEHVCAYICGSGNANLIVVAPRWFVKLAPEDGDMPLGEKVWGDTAIEVPPHLAEKTGRNLLTQESVNTTPSAHASLTLKLADLLTSFPVALVAL